MPKSEKIDKTDLGEFPISTPPESYVYRDSDGSPIGAMVFLSATDLAELGINPEITHSVAYWVDDGRFTILESELARFVPE